MKRSTLAIFFILLASFGVSADDRPIADMEMVMELKQFCEDIADDEGTDGMELNDFLLQCVNDELDAEGYQPIDKLPK